LSLLADFAQRLRDSQAGEAEPNPPRQQTRCGNCPHGFPEPIAAADIEKCRKASVPLLVLERPGGQTYHCVCGDRFGTAPPHRKAQRLELRAVLADRKSTS